MKHENVIIWLLIVLVFLLSFLSIKDSVLLVDEVPHFWQIEDFYEKNYSVNPDQTLIPGFHMFMAGVGKVGGGVNKVFLRGVITCLALLSVFLVYLITKKNHGNVALIKTLEYLFIPILFPFFFLIYSDLLSLLFVLAMYYFYLKKKLLLSGIFGLISILIRQNNVLWVGFIFLLIYYDDFGIKIKWNKMFDFIKKTWLFILVFLLFISYVLITGGIAFGDTDAHPGGIHFGNIYFMLFLMFFFFLPLHIANVKEALKKIRDWKWLVFIVVFFGFFMLTFINNHPYNIGWGDYFLRNMILIFFSQTVLLKSLFFIPVLGTVLSLSVTKLANKKYYLLYPLTLLFLLPSWLIEERYYLIPIVLFVLFKRERNDWTDYATVVLNAIMTFVIFYVVSHGIIFL